MEERRQSELGGYGRTTVWLRQHGLNIQQIADLFDTSVGHVRQLEFRGRRSRDSSEIVSPLLLDDTGLTTPPTAELRRFLGIRAEEDSVAIAQRSKRSMEELDAKIESLGAQFWQGVRYEASIQQLRELLPEVGYPSQFRRIRQRARIHELCCETHLHAGNSPATLQEGLRAYHLYRVAFHESGELCDISQVGRVSRLLSQTFLLRRESGLVLHFLRLHRDAQERLGRPPRPEYHHQIASLAFQEDSMVEAEIVRKQCQLAMNKLAETVDYGKAKERYEVRDIGERYLPLVDPINWEASQELCHSQLQHYPSGDIHVGLNVAFTAACGLSTGDGEAEREALSLLDEHAGAAVGYRRLETNFALLRLTRRLPLRLRGPWARFALVENAYDHRERFPRYSNSGA